MESANESLRVAAEELSSWHWEGLSEGDGNDEIDEYSSEWTNWIIYSAFIFKDAEKKNGRKTITKDNSQSTARTSWIDGRRSFN